MVEPDPAEETPATPTAAPAAPKEPTYRVVLRLEVPSDATPGFHVFRIVTPRGASNALTLQVVSDPVVKEQPEPHGAAAAAQRLTVPVVVNAALQTKGERDFYAFDVASGAELCFEVLPSFKMDVPYRAQAELCIWEQTGSWFDPERAAPLALDGPVLSWEPIHRIRRRDFAAEFVLFPALTNRFERAGRFFVSVAAFLGRGGADYAYQLRIAPGAARDSARLEAPPLGTPAHPDPSDWLERDSATMRQFGSFSRRLDVGRLRELGARTVAPEPKPQPAAAKELATGSNGGVYGKGIAPGPTPAAEPPPREAIAVALEQEPNDSLEAAAAVTAPVLIQGTIDRLHR